MNSVATFSFSLNHKNEEPTQEELWGGLNKAVMDMRLSPDELEERVGAVVDTQPDDLDYSVGEFEDKIREMIDTSTVEILKEAKRLFESGAVDADNYNGDYRLPKNILHVAMHNVSLQWLFPEADKSEIENLKAF